MKKFFTLAGTMGLLAFAAHAQITDPSPYCDVSYSDPYNMMEYVSVNGTQHNLGASQDIYTSDGFSYLYYDQVSFPDMAIGSANTIEIKFYATADVEPGYFAVYIDVNQNSMFDANECYMQNANTINAFLPSLTDPAQTITHSITIPANAVPGQTRMRVIRGMYVGQGGDVYNPNFTYAACQPFVDATYGRAVDYNVNLVNTGSVAPTAAFIANNTTPIANNDVVSLVDMSVGNPTTWEWTITPATFTFQGTSNANSQSPQVIFNNVGLYTVKLKVTNANGADSITNIDYINVLPAVVNTDTNLVLKSNLNVNPQNIYWNDNFNIYATFINGTSTPFVGDFTAAVYRSTDSSFVAYIDPQFTQTLTSFGEVNEIFHTNGVAAMYPGSYFAKVLFRSNLGNGTWALVPTLDSTVSNRTVINVLQDPTGIKDAQMAALIQVYPIPATDAIHLNWGQFVAKVNHVEMVSLDGRSVFASSVNSKDVMTIPVQHLADGVYFLKFNTDAGVFTKKVSINK